MSNHPKPDDSTGQTRQRIIQSAMQLFGQVGYSQATTRAIAKAAGVNEVTLFRHFGSKKNLLLACMQEFNASGFSETFEHYLTGDYPADILMMARLQVQDTTAKLDVLRLMLCDAQNVPELRQAMLSGGQGNLALLSAYFQRQIDAGIVRSGINADTLAWAFESLFSTPVIFGKVFQESPAPGLGGDDPLLQLAAFFVRATAA